MNTWVTYVGLTLANAYTLSSLYCGQAAFFVNSWPDLIVSIWLSIITWIILSVLKANRLITVFYWLIRNINYTFIKLFISSISTILLEKCPTFFFAKIWWISINRACMRRPWILKYICEFFFACKISAQEGWEWGVEKAPQWGTS